MAIDPLSSITGVVTLAEVTSLDPDGRLIILRTVRLPAVTVDVALERLRDTPHSDHSRLRVVGIRQFPSDAGANAAVLWITYAQPRPELAVKVP